MMQRHKKIHRLQRLVLFSAIGWLVVLGPGVPPVAAEIPGIELSFDDIGPTTALNADPKNMAGTASNANQDPNSPGLSFKLIGDAKRTATLKADDGFPPYGRSIELDGNGDYLEVTNIYSGYRTPHLYSWWQLPTNPIGGTFWEDNCHFRVRLDSQGEIYVDVFNDMCVAIEHATNLIWDSDGDWHHLIVRIYRDTNQKQRFAITLDFAPQPQADIITADILTINPTAMVRFGEDIDGWVDEIQAADYFPGVEARFDWDPDDCGVVSSPTTTVCEEHVLIVDGDSLDTDVSDVPVRYKILYESDQCTTATPCRVVFALSGGGACGDHYMQVKDRYLNKMVELDPAGSHLAVVTVDPTCWAPTSIVTAFKSYPDEVTQMVAVKNEIATDPELDFLDVSGDFYATGCSHGAGIVLRWAVEGVPLATVDQPARTFARSAVSLGEHVDCEYHEVWCGKKQDAFDESHFGIPQGVCAPPLDGPWPHGHEPEDPSCPKDFMNAQSPYISLVNTTLTNARDIGRSWGVALTGASYPPVCIPPQIPGEPSTVGCAEEGSLAATEGGRQFRKKWREVETASDRNGYFIENSDAHCAHCGLSPKQIDCAIMYLEGGRTAVEADSVCMGFDNAAGSPQVCTGYPL